MPDVDEFLMHFGVKGMKWGNASRNAEAVLLRNAELAKDAVAKGSQVHLEHA